MIKFSAVRSFFVLLFVCSVLAVPAMSRAEDPGPYTVEIADVGKSQEFAAQLQKLGFATSIPPKNIWVNEPQNNSAVWIGKNIPLGMLRVVMPEAYKFNPYIQFLHVVGDRGEKPPVKVDNTLHIGGNIEAAMVKKLNILAKEEVLAALTKAATVEDFHKWLHEKNKPKPAADAKPAS